MIIESLIKFKALLEEFSKELREKEERINQLDSSIENKSRQIQALEVKLSEIQKYSEMAQEKARKDVESISEMARSRLKEAETKMMEAETLRAVLRERERKLEDNSDKK